jgi:hypothetical protein
MCPFGTQYTSGGDFIIISLNRDGGGGNSAGQIQAGIRDGNSIQVTSGFTANTWSHLILCKTGNTLSVFLNGTRVGTITENLGTVPTTPFEVGDCSNLTRPFAGYISDCEFVNGSRYDATQTTVTIPSAPITTPVANTSLLCNFTNAGILDNTGFNALETVGNAQIDTSVKKYGTGSMKFDGTGDWLLMPTTAELQMGTGDFTWEAWVYIRSLPTSGNFETLWCQRATSAGFGGPAIVIDSSGNYLLFIGNAASNNWQISSHDSGHNVSLNTWQHIALVRNGSSINLYQDGNAGTSTTISQAVGTSGATSIGAGAADGSQAIDGYIDDLRITKGIARYTTTFTPPDKSLPDIGE